MTTEERLTNGTRAARALDAVNAYASASPGRGTPELTFFLDFERDALPGGDQDRLSGLLCGLMHYAERRGLSFPDALSAARQEHGRQRTTYQPGNAVRRAGSSWRTPAPGDLPLTGEVLRARPGRPAEYEVDFITSREWLPETALAPASPFPVVITEFGTFSSAHVANRCLERAVDEMAHDYLDQERAPGSGLVRDIDTLLTALSGWSGLGRDTLLRPFSQAIAEKDGQLIAGAAGAHPAALAALSAPTSPAAALGGPRAAGSGVADVLPFQKALRPSQAGRRR
jgi:hypothetical protein